MTEKKTTKENSGSSFITKKLSELGPNLPLGIEQDGVYEKAIEVKRWTLKQEKELGDIREENKHAKIGQYVSMVLAHMCSKIGPWNFDEMKTTDKLLKISQMFSGDVFYVYCWLRYKSLGNEMILDLTCPKCDKSFKYSVDMRDIEVNCGSNIKDFFWEHELFDPYEIRGNTVKKIVLGPTRWNTYETIDSGSFGGIGDVKSKMILSSIYKLDGEDIILTENEIEETGKRDLETMINHLENERIGPDMSVSVRCACKSNFVHAIGWNFDDFFAVSSR